MKAASCQEWLLILGTRVLWTKAAEKVAVQGSFLLLLLGARLAKNCSPYCISSDIVCDSVVLYIRNLGVHTWDIYNQN